VEDDFEGDLDPVKDIDENTNVETGMPTPATPSEDTDAGMEVDNPSTLSSATVLPIPPTLTEHSTAALSVAGPAATLAETSPDQAFSHPPTASNEAWDVMDLASFLEFSIASTHCLEILHKSGQKHREVRANAFHVNIHSGVVRFAHFGNRSESLETTGGPSQLVLRASGLLAGPHGFAGRGDPADGGEDTEEKERMTEEGEGSEQEFEVYDSRKVKEAICYLAPEQTGTAETNNEDHRTDLYALGVLFWTLLVGHGTLPFEGSPVELLHKVVQVRPREVHEIRRDVPVVLSAIIAKASLSIDTS